MIPAHGAAVLESLRTMSSELARRYQTAKPFPHLVIDHFLEPAFSRELAENFPSEAGYEEGEPGRVLERPADLGRAYRELDDLTSGAEFRQLLERISGYEGVARQWGMVPSRVRDGSSMAPHLNGNLNPVTGWTRVLVGILYLNEGWQAAWGGRLELRSRPDHRCLGDVSVVPRASRFVLFEEGHWHAVSRVCLPGSESGRSRLALIFSFYCPPSEAPAVHPAFVELAPLPARFAQGRLLSEGDLAELRRIVAVRDGHLERLRQSLDDLPLEKAVCAVRARRLPCELGFQVGRRLSRADVERLKAAIGARDEELRRLRQIWLGKDR